MKTLFLGSVALIALGLGAPAAFAAERALPAYTPPPPPVPVYTWSGCYVGASAGVSTGRTDGTNTTAATQVLAPPGFTNLAALAAQPLRGPFDMSGFIGGFQGGCNYQVGQWVFGFEGDGSATNKEGQVFPATPFLLTTTGIIPVSPNSVFQLQERWLATARARLGWAI